MASYRTLRNLRRCSQAVFLLLFAWLLLATFYHGVVEEGEGLAETLPYPVSLFLQIDPLAALSSLLAAGRLHEKLLWGLIVIVPTFFLGRIFCGWVCPFGTLNHLCGLGSRRPAAVRARRNRPGRHQVIKYGTLFFFLGAALLGVVLAGWLDPLCFLVRGLGLSVLPALERAIRGAADRVGGGTEGVRTLHRFLDAHFLGPGVHRFYEGWVLGLLLLLVLFLNRIMARFWCRVICPLGALLGVLARFTALGLHKDPDRCTRCTRCTLSCPAAASPEPGEAWRAAECFLCFNCAAECPEGALSFRGGIQAAETKVKPDLSRRGFLGSLAAGIAVVPMLRAARDPRRNPLPFAVRPPGACGEIDFLERCIRCGQCMKVCPNNALQPAFFQAGVEGIWTPVIVPRIGYCEPTCTLCWRVCPTGAIRPFTVEDKKANRVKIGTAFFDRGRCLPWAMQIDCMVCEEFCPTSPKAIRFEKYTLELEGGGTRVLNRPHVDPAVCTGCGVCEHVCPVADRAAVRVTSVGESRSAVNHILLSQEGGPRGSTRPR